MRALFFSQIRDVAGITELEVNISDLSGLDDVWQALIKLRPALAEFQPSTRLARNGEYADNKTIFCNSDEVALIPPVSGG